MEVSRSAGRVARGRQVEQAIAELARRSRDNRLTLEELEGGSRYMKMAYRPGRFPK